MRWAGALRRELSARNQQIAVRNGSLHELTSGRNAQRHLRMQRKPAAWKFLSRLLAEHLRKSGMGAPASEGPYRIAQAHGPVRPGDGGNWIARTARTRCL